MTLLRAATIQNMIVSHKRKFLHEPISARALADQVQMSKVSTEEKLAFLYDQLRLLANQGILRVVESSSDPYLTTFALD